MGYVEPAHPAAPMATHEETFEHHDMHEQYHQEEDEDDYELPLHQRQSVEEHPLAQPTHPMADTGITAVALYDYQAGKCSLLH